MADRMARFKGAFLMLLLLSTHGCQRIRCTNGGEQSESGKPVYGPARTGNRFLHPLLRGDGGGQSSPTSF
uniref:Putative secreted protein n=1 Tax=Anopheles triannulatus TaxID=58253 RepID=A0A2M4B664_9DIPT